MEKSINLEDKRVQKTRARIKEALKDLVAKKSVEDITISELCEKAEINRKTFYAHYNSIDDVVLECQNDSAKELILLLRDFLQDGGNLSPNYLFACLNVICRQSIPFFGSAAEVEKNHLLIQKYTSILQQVIYENLYHFAISNGVDATSLEFISSFIAGGIVNTYYEWLRNPNGVTIEQISDLTSKMITTGLTTL